ncbi:hypothetical protein V6N13_035516 [Hibiscus sabdariffa]|uniref:Uncharacterized protein n=1 Tax=Hibiscus sabdariffa TaxID=183260 RepID=A0ABR2S9W0_9ROSI
MLRDSCMIEPIVKPPKSSIMQGRMEKEQQTAEKVGENVVRLSHSAMPIAPARPSRSISGMGLANPNQ